jgi:hypothetical protein
MNMTVQRTRRNWDDFFKAKVLKDLENGKLKVAKLTDARTGKSILGVEDERNKGRVIPAMLIERWKDMARTSGLGSEFQPEGTPAPQKVSSASSDVHNAFMVSGINSQFTPKQLLAEITRLNIENFKLRMEMSQSKASKRA